MADNTSQNAMDDYKTKFDEAERERKAMYNEMKTEREKRQSLEEKMSKMEQEYNSRFSTSAPQDENLQWITNFAQKPKEVLYKEWENYTKPIRETNSKVIASLQERECFDWLADEEGTSVSKLRKSKLVDEVKKIISEKNLGQLPMLAGVQAAYEFYKMEKKQKEEEEKLRNNTIQATTTQSIVGSSPASPSTGRVWKESEIAAMDLATFQHYAKDINLAKGEGRIVTDVSKVNEKGRMEVSRS